MTCVHAKRGSVVIGGRSVSVFRVDSLRLWWLSLFIAGEVVGGFRSDTVVFRRCTVALSVWVCMR